MRAPKATMAATVAVAAIATLLWEKDPPEELEVSVAASSEVVCEARRGTEAVEAKEMPA